jgi:hypothetical protein
MTRTDIRVFQFPDDGNKHGSPNIGLLAYNYLTLLLAREGCVEFESKVVTVVHAHAVQVYWGSRCVASLILDLGSRCRRVVNFKLGRFIPGNEPSYSLDMRLGGPQIRFGRFREEKNFLLMPDSNPGLLSS